MTNKTREDMVREFVGASTRGNYYTAPENVRVELNMIVEELDELVDATSRLYSERTKEARAQLCKEWADLQYVVSSFAVFFDIPTEEAFRRVHESNMSKLVDGRFVYREDGKILKPDTYTKPDMGGL